MLHFEGEGGDFYPSRRGYIRFHLGVNYITWTLTACVWDLQPWESCRAKLENIIEHKPFWGGFLALHFVIWGAIYPNFYDYVPHPQGYVPTKFGRAAPNSFQDKCVTS